MFIYPYKAGSQSAKNLAEALGAKRIKLEGSKFKGDPSKIVINWGSSSMSEQTEKCQVLNKPAAVAMASNKLTFFNKVKNIVSIPEFTTKSDVAKEWIEEGSTVLARTTLTGHSGEGIYVIESMEEFDNFNKNSAKVWVKYIPKKDEYRVHVVAGKVVDVRRKGLRNDFNKNNANWKIRNHGNGFVFVKNDVDPPQEVLEQSVAAIAVCGLDFGAVDVIWNNFREKAFVLEINTAPGLEGSTIDSYSEAFNWLYAEEDRYKQWDERRKKIQSEYMSTIIKSKKVALNLDDYLEMDTPQPTPWG